MEFFILFRPVNILCHLNTVLSFKYFLYFSTKTFRIVYIFLCSMTFHLPN